MSQLGWRLADYFDQFDDKDALPAPVDSEAELRAQLERMVDLPPRVVELYSPDYDFLRIGIGGRYAGAAWVRLPTMKLLLAPQAAECESAAFSIQGGSCTLRSDELHSPREIIDLACDFYKTGKVKVPAGMAWRG